MPERPQPYKERTKKDMQRRSPEVLTRKAGRGRSGAPTCAKPPARRVPMTIDDKPRIVGGGPKKLLYTVDTIRRMGVGKAARALTSHNTCKACAYGMGGQRGEIGRAHV